MYTSPLQTFQGTLCNCAFNLFQGALCTSALHIFQRALYSSLCVRAHCIHFHRWNISTGKSMFPPHCSLTSQSWPLVPALPMLIFFTISTLPTDKERYHLNHHHCTRNTSILLSNNYSVEKVNVENLSEVNFWICKVTICLLQLDPDESQGKSRVQTWHQCWWPLAWLGFLLSAPHGLCEICVQIKPGLPDQWASPSTNALIL